jgi:hypothetical protein
MLNSGMLTLCPNNRDSQKTADWIDDLIVCKQRTCRRKHRWSSWFIRDADSEAVTDPSEKNSSLILLSKSTV